MVRSVRSSADGPPVHVDNGPKILVPTVHLMDGIGWYTKIINLRWASRGDFSQVETIPNKYHWWTEVNRQTDEPSISWTDSWIPDGPWIPDKDGRICSVVPDFRPKFRIISARSADRPVCFVKINLAFVEPDESIPLCSVWLTAYLGIKATSLQSIFSCDRDSKWWWSKLFCWEFLDGFSKWPSRSLVSQSEA